MILLVKFFLGHPVYSNVPHSGGMMGNVALFNQRLLRNSFVVAPGSWLLHFKKISNS